MKNAVKIQVRAYAVELRDIRTGETVKDDVILTKEQLKAADDTGLTVSGMFSAIYERKGYRVAGISAPVKRELSIPLIVDGCKIRIDGDALRGYLNEEAAGV